QWLDAEAIACEEQRAVAPVVQCERPLAVQPVQHLLAPLLPAVDEDLRVGARAEPVTERAQLAAQLDIVVDLAVEHHDDRTVLVRQRLRTALDIDDAEAGMREPDTGTGIQPVAVRA